ncbi:hypothetical protein JMJ77_0009893 [Colletotrichum scovillei]|uniref:Uncharacterized protein n=1 Tax=Colletotrichum scovillei TaxID=1209932 RepID=A0A9P7QS30_9PEZI|nr:hypothetical protein JMJ77_0009893 [Colletotrichum scovillei]KAG7060480.1 hypothetical protein JMJ76_0009281 [Colletotrichum scovillei]
MAIGTTPKSVIVTGGASGIGLTIVRHFASQGGKVAIFDVNAASGKSIASDVASEYPQSTVTFHQCDVSSWNEQAQAFSNVYDAFGRIDIVFANAGIAEGMSNALATIHPDAPQEPNLKVVAVDLNGVIYSVKLAIHYINKNEISGGSRGSIICTASDAALYPFPVGPMYAAAKAGVIGLVRSTAPILEDLKIQINTMAPAALVTPMSTLIKGVSQITGDTSLNGKVIEIHDAEPTIRDEPYQFVSDGTRHNQEKAWEMFKFFKASTGGLHAP